MPRLFRVIDADVVLSGGTDIFHRGTRDGMRCQEEVVLHGAQLLNMVEVHSGTCRQEKSHLLLTGRRLCMRGPLRSTVNQVEIHSREFREGDDLRASKGQHEASHC